MDSKDPLADLLPFLSAPHLHSSWLSWKCKIQIQRFPGWPSDFSVWFPSPYFLIVLTCPSLTNWSFSTQEKTSMQSSLLKMHIDHHIAQILNMRKHFVQMIVYETDSRLSDKKKEIRKIPKRSILKTRVQKDFCIVLMPPDCNFWHFMILYIVNIIDK